MAEIAIAKQDLVKRAFYLSQGQRTLERQFILERCRRDPVFFINTFCYTFDPRRKNGTRLPFILFDRQVEYIRWREKLFAEGRSGLVEKSRDMGVSWLNCAHQAHGLLFREGFKGTFGSRKQDLVDKRGNMDSLLQKIRFLLQNLPGWMLPPRGELKDNLLNIVNATNGSMITGESGDNAGRGGRSTIYDYDEFAFVEHAGMVDAAISQNTDTVIYTSTPNGVGNLYYQKRFSGQLEVFTFRYNEHPGKDEAWLEEQKRRLDPIVVAREILIDYHASIEGVVIPAKWVTAAIDFRFAGMGIRSAGLDVAEEGHNLNVLIPRQGIYVMTPESWAYGTTTQTAYKARQYCQEFGIQRLNYDANGVGAGVTGTLQTIGMTESLGFEISGVYTGGNPSDNIYLKFNDRPGKEIFKNLRAELWWLLRTRFEKTYEVVNNIAYHPEDECISIPNHNELIAQLTQPLYKFDDVGKIVIESKKAMKDRGIKSPDFADSLVLAFSDLDPDAIAWWM